MPKNVLRYLGTNLWNDLKSPWVYVCFSGFLVTVRVLLEASKMRLWTSPLFGYCTWMPGLLPLGRVSQRKIVRKPSTTTIRSQIWEAVSPGNRTADWKVVLVCVVLRWGGLFTLSAGETIALVKIPSIMEHTSWSTVHGFESWWQSGIGQRLTDMLVNRCWKWLYTSWTMYCTANRWWGLQQNRSVIFATKRKNFIILYALVWRSIEAPLKENLWLLHVSNIQKSPTFQFLYFLSMSAPFCRDSTGAQNLKTLNSGWPMMERTL